MYTTYYAILDDYIIINNDNLSILKEISFVIQLFRRDRNENSNSRPYTYIPINNDDTLAKIRIGDFEVVHIAEDVAGKGADISRKIIIHDYKTKVNRPYYSHIGSVEFVVKELYPLLNKLNEYGSWEVYEKLKEMESLKVANVELKEKVAELEKKITSLQEQDNLA